MQDLLDSIKARGGGGPQQMKNDQDDPSSVNAVSDHTRSSDGSSKFAAASFDGGTTQASTTTGGSSSEMMAAPPPKRDEALESTLNNNSAGAAANVSSTSLVSGDYEDTSDEHYEDEEDHHHHHEEEMEFHELQQEQEEHMQQEEEQHDGEYDPALEDSFIEEEVIEDSEGFVEEEYVIEDGDPDERLEGIMEETAHILRQQGEDVPSVSADSSSQQQQREQQEQDYEHQNHHPPAPMQDVEVLEGDDTHSVHSGLSLDGTTEVKSTAHDTTYHNNNGAAAAPPNGSFAGNKSTQSTPSEAAFRAADHLLGQQQQQQDDASRQSSRKSSVRSAAEVAAAVGVAAPPQAASQEQQEEEDPYHYIKRQSGSSDDLRGNSNNTTNNNAQDPSAFNMRLSQRPAREPSGNVALRHSGPPSHRYGDDPTQIREVQPTPPVRQQRQPQPPQRAAVAQPAVRAQAPPPPPRNTMQQQQQQKPAARNVAPAVAATAAAAAASAAAAAPGNHRAPPLNSSSNNAAMPRSGAGGGGDGKVHPHPLGGDGNKANPDDPHPSDDDIETGTESRDGGATADTSLDASDSSKKKRDAAASSSSQSQLPPPPSNNNRGPDNNSGTLKVMGALVCLVAIVLAIVLPLTLRNNDGDDAGPRDVTIPTTPPQAPLVPPTPSPTPVGIAWEEVFPTMGGPRGSGFGTAVALDETVLAVGAPRHEGTGGVFTAVNAGDNWELPPAFLGEEDGSDFGASVDIQAGQMIVGAPLVNLADSLSPVGAAYFYAFNPPAKQWDQIGPVLRGDQDILAAGGRYGAAVALGRGDSLPRVVVAAPLSALDLETFEVGRVYTYEGTGIAWNTLETEPLVGATAFDWFGSSVDMISDGSLFIVGAPGQENAGMNGYFRIYSWTDDGAWTMEYQIDGEDGEALGSTVVALSDSVFAVGAPEYKDGRGRVSVYERSGNGQYAWIAQVEGNANERIGRANSVTGSFSQDEGLLIVATQAGDIVTYEYTDGGIAEEAPVRVHNTGFADVVVEYSSTDGLVMGTAEGDEIDVLEVSSPSKNVLPVDSSPTTISQAPAAAPFPNSTTTANDAPAGSSTVEQIPATDASNITAMGWSKSADNFQPKVDGANFGTSVSLASSRMAVGGPFTLGNGAALVYQKIDGMWETTASGQLFGESEGDEFGAAVDVTDRLLIVGAPRVLVNGTLTESGAAYCYISNGGEWQKLGPTLRGDETVLGANELFGAAVAASTNGVVLVGAPGSAVGIEVGSQGRFYVFEFDDSKTQWTLALDIFARVPNVTLGSALDIARDGSHFAIGAQGQSGTMGYVEIYEKDGTEFILAGVVQSTEENDGYGTSVSVISPTGDIIAVGAPNDLNGRGRVYVYQKNSTGTYIQVGDPIVGETGERLGEMVAGESSSPRVFLGTAQGRVKQFNYDAGLKAWVSGGTVDTGLGSNLQALAVSSQSQAFAAGGNNDAAIYEPPIVVR